jgi:HSP20 family molecular chaperone IbpA
MSAKPSNSSPSPLLSSEHGESQQKKWVRTPPIDIFETEEGLVLRADLPGVTIEGLDLQILDNRLTLFGHVESQTPPEATLLHQEYHAFDFVRSFILSDDLDHDRITAGLKHGVLEVVLPRTPRSQPRRISVQTN